MTAWKAWRWPSARALGRIPCPDRTCSSSLRARLALLVGLLLCVLAAPMVLLGAARLEADSRRWVESRAVGIARLASAASEAALDFNDPIAAEALLGKLSSTRDAVWAALLLPGGTPLARWGGPPSDLGSVREGDQEVRYLGDLVVVRVPVESRAGRRGTLALAFDLAELRARQDESRRWAYRGAAFVLALGVLAALAIGTVVARPLRRMTDLAQRIAAGDLSAPSDLETRRRDEAGALARAFELMVTRLGEKRMALARTNAELAQKLGELKRTQEQLVVADRRISVGRLAAGVAHEVNNPLAYVLANLRFVAEELPAFMPKASPASGEGACAGFEDVKDALTEAQQGAERIGQIVKGLKTFSRADDDRRERLELAAPLEAAIATAAHELKQRARVVRRYGAAPQVNASEVRLMQVFLNLLINAAQATPEGGAERHTVTVTTGTNPSGLAVVEVIDTGCGIPPENLGRLFDPFFTTKPVGVGTGLGLSISYGIVSSLGGRIEVESEVGRGSTFRVLLPPAMPGDAAGAPAPAPSPAPARAASLLVIDDEPLVGTSLARALGGELHVDAVASAREALERLEACPYEHILCDVMMPDMTGPAFHGELERRSPALAARVIFMTGGAFTPATQSFLATWKGGLLEKPLNLDRLRSLMGGAPS